MQEVPCPSDTRQRMTRPDRHTPATRRRSRSRGGGRRLVAAALLALAAVAAGALAAAVPASAATLTLQVSRPAVVYGGTVVASGAVDPVAEGQEVVLSYAGVDVGTALTDASGAFAFEFAPPQSGDVVVRLSADGSASAPVPLVVRPAVKVSHGTLIPFLRTRFLLKVTPAGYDGAVTARVFHRGRRVATVRGRVRDGRAVLLVPLRGIEWFSVRFALEPTAAFGSREVKKSVELEWRRLSAAQREALIREHGLGPVPAPKLGTDQELLAALDARSLGGWAEQDVAMPARFARAREAAARLLEPKAVRVQLPPATLRTAEEVETYLDGLRKAIMAQIESGHPVIL